MNLRFLLGLFLTINAVGLVAQNRLKPYDEYIAKYAPLAQDQQRRHKIPASITLAQGLIESGAGKSEMAVASNNHFGIKCHNTWKGESVTFFDDGVNSCFRKYDKVADSYEDHSMFLVNSARYRGLFLLDLTDYTGWARGLQKAGYATDRQYADKLIKVIETYDLNDYVKNIGSKRETRAEKRAEKVAKEGKIRKPRKTRTVKVNGLVVDSVDFTSDIIRNAKDYNAMQPTSSGSSINPLSTHVIGYVGLIPCIKAKYGDTFASLGDEFGLSARSIRKYNDVEDDYKLVPGETVYLDKKSTWWEGENPLHTVVAGETMRDIAQKYALQLKALYDMNDMKPGTPVKAGQRIKLRNPEKMSAFWRAMHQTANTPDSTVAH
ncbi:MAG: glucosaminidase domain-containing protein [Bacteroidota bacterium]|nr:glucosaminidase domain-containing protein [Bacteroidota bacterium]